MTDPFGIYEKYRDHISNIRYEIRKVEEYSKTGAMSRTPEYCVVRLYRTLHFFIHILSSENLLEGISLKKPSWEKEGMIFSLSLEDLRRAYLEITDRILLAIYLLDLDIFLPTLRGRNGTIFGI